MTCLADAKEIDARYKEKNEITEEIPEEEVAALREKANQFEVDHAKILEVFDDKIKLVKQVDVETGVSKETMRGQISKLFKARVVLVNHEKRLEVDVACSNLAIKYNMLYVSVYQLIKQEIEAETELGRCLVQSKRTKILDFGPQVKNVDPFEEKIYSAVHYD